MGEGEALAAQMFMGSNLSKNHVLPGHMAICEKLQAQGGA